MDGHRFDDLTRALVRSTSRRAVLKRFGAGAIGALGASLGAGHVQAGPKKCKYQGSSCKSNAECCTLVCCNRVCCGDGQTCCNGQCVRVCPPGQALNAACVCDTTGPACSSASQCPQPADPCQSATCVGGRCGFAALNGLACDDGNACTSGTTCQNGACGGGTVISCDDGNPCTADSCDPATGCVNAPISDVPCGTGGTCQDGQCVTPDLCASLDCDDDNPCTADTCSGGTCFNAPVAPGTPCTTSGGGAGACDATGTCVAFACNPGSTRSCYGGPSGTVGVGVCRAGTQTCQEDGSGFGPCVGEVTPSAEVCDGLDNDCDGFADEGFGVGTPCQTGRPGICAAGTIRCQDGQAVCVQNQQPQQETCNGLDDDCDGLVDELVFCPGGKSCINGQCVCLAGQHECSGTCVSNFSPQTCGASCSPCPVFPNTTPTCDGTSCGFICNAGTGDCDGSRVNGCETNLRSDVNNCGQCGRVCQFPNATAACVNGTCVIASCNAGYADCDGNPTNGCETDLTDGFNCGACGAICVGPCGEPGSGMTSECQDGSCVCTGG